jgi:hypothetical protein
VAAVAKDIVDDEIEGAEIRLAEPGSDPGGMPGMPFGGNDE